MFRARYYSSYVYPRLLSYRCLNVIERSLWSEPDQSVTPIWSKLWVLVEGMRLLAKLLDLSKVKRFVVLEPH